MARNKNEVNRSAEIRALFGQNPKLTAAEVVAALAHKGIPVTVALVYKVKKGMRKAQRMKAAANGREADINQSAEIRAVLADRPELTAAEVVDALAKKGITVTAALVYNVKSNTKPAKKKKAAAKGKKVQMNGHGANGAATANPVRLVLEVKNLASAVGGIKHLKQLVDALAE